MAPLAAMIALLGCTTLPRAGTNGTQKRKGFEFLDLHDNLYVSSAAPADHVVALGRSQRDVITPAVLNGMCSGSLELNSCSVEAALEKRLSISEYVTWQPRFV